MKVIDDGEGEDVNKGKGVNVTDLGDGEANIGNNEGDFFFRLLFKGITFLLVLLFQFLAGNQLYELQTHR